MAWTAPRTWVSTEVVSASLMNTHVRDNLLETGPAMPTASGQILVSDAANSIVARTPAGASVATNESTTSTSYTDLTTSGPAAASVTTGSTCLIWVSARMWDETAGQAAWMSYAVSGASTVSASDNNAATFQSDSANQAARSTYVAKVTGLNAGSNTFTAKYKTAGGTAHFQHRRILVIPI